ncbi:MAG: DNA gyrase C-terminal beta-propeller domain-containing protein, partial [Flavobacteriales bacterium]
GAKGVKTINVTDKTGDLVAIKVVEEDDDLMIITKSGLTIRMEMDEIRVMGRATQGVKVIRLDDDDEIASIAKVEVDEQEKQASNEDNPGTDLASDANPTDVQ